MPPTKGPGNGRCAALSFYTASMSDRAINLAHQLFHAPARANSWPRHPGPKNGFPNHIISKATKYHQEQRGAGIQVSIHVVTRTHGGEALPQNALTATDSGDLRLPGSPAGHNGERGSPARDQVLQDAWERMRVQDGDQPERGGHPLGALRTYRACGSYTATVE